MPVGRTYLDHNATSPLRPEARAAMLNALDAFGNASSVHAEGRRARGIVETAREQVAALMGALTREIVFTSGGTEANNLVTAGGWDVIVAAQVEHDSVSAPVQKSGARVIAWPVLATGIADVGALQSILSDLGRDAGRVLVTLQWANNETGIVQPIAQAAAVSREFGAALHTDAVQAAGKLSLDFRGSGADFMTVSGHKIGAPKGVGALVVRDGFDLAPSITGGGQERGYRAGTENVAGIAAFGAAAAVAKGDLSVLPARLGRLRDRCEQGVFGPGAMVIGAEADRLCNTSCIAVPGKRAETLVIALDLAGIAVSAGAACSSGKVKQSHVLTAMGLPPEIAGSAIRVSTGWNTTDNDIDAFLAAFAKIVGGRIVGSNNGLARKVA